ncbi:hypothetical protein HOS58_gp23 [Streptomyces phage Attoomi]|uniref:Uncharacterized protein n=1 Tax=Streptomyces phage Attoomi TaxID=2059881 RepID=A0A2H5BLL6_9CAUD|nr:hypothetical protein HOS58_gp23 [Streptomyces phage Attoomi]AUG87155.1 hypothetical protein SEA_ATTOOMI_23 [Streptomyces phage Attoomi]
MLDTLLNLVKDNPVRVRAAVGALLVLVGQYVPAVKELAGSEAVVDGVTLVLLVLLGESASRKVAAKYNPAE